MMYRRFVLSKASITINNSATVFFAVEAANINVSADKAQDIITCVEESALHARDRYVFKVRENLDKTVKLLEEIKQTKIASGSRDHYTIEKINQLLMEIK